MPNVRELFSRRRSNTENDRSDRCFQLDEFFIDDVPARPQPVIPR